MLQFARPALVTTREIEADLIVEEERREIKTELVRERAIRVVCIDQRSNEFGTWIECMTQTGPCGLQLFIVALVGFKVITGKTQVQVAEVRVSVTQFTQDAVLWDRAPCTNRL